jgi:hypothetical protein
VRKENNVLKLICDCGNEEDFKDMLFDIKRKRPDYIVRMSDKFRIKVSSHHNIHIDCKVCGKKINWCDVGVK